MVVQPVETSDADEWLRLRVALWPDSDPDKESSDTKLFLADSSRPVLPTLQAVFVCQRPDDGLCGLVRWVFVHMPMAVRLPMSVISKRGTSIPIGVIRGSGGHWS